MKILHFTHGDFDGKGCIVVGTIFNKLLELRHDTANTYDVLIVGNPSDLMKKLQENEVFFNEFDKIYVTDLNIKQDVAEFLTRYEDKINYMDHHRIDFEPTEEMNKWLTIKSEDENGKTCGTKLFYEYMMSQLTEEELEAHDIMLNTLKGFVETVNQYDNYIFGDNDQPPAYNRYCHSVLLTEFIDAMVTIIEEHNEFPDVENIRVERYLYIPLLVAHSEDREEKYVESKVKLGEMVYDKIDIEGFKTENYIYVRAEQFTSAIASTLLARNPEANFAVVETGFGLSFRSRGDHDVSVLARHLGGGGHKAAAGCGYKMDVIKKIHTEERPISYHTDDNNLIVIQGDNAVLIKGDDIEISDTFGVWIKKGDITIIIYDVDKYITFVIKEPKGETFHHNASIDDFRKVMERHNIV